MARVLLALTVLTGWTAWAYDNGVVTSSEPPRGWSTWCTNEICGIPDRCSEWEVKKKAKSMVDQGLTDLGYKWVLLDDCWSDTDRDENGELQPSPHLFPSGMKNLADSLHAMGMYLGLYTCIGTKTCKKSRPGSYGHYETDANTMAKWGIDMVKTDYCNKPAEEDGQELYTQFSNALNATGRPMLFSMCQWGNDEVYKWGGDIAQMYRVQMDHLPMWHWPPTATGKGLGCGTRDIIEYMALLDPSKWVRQGAWMDPDFLETLYHFCTPARKNRPAVCTTMDFTASRTEMAFWTLWSAPLLMATDPENLSEEKRSIIANKEVLAVHNDPLWIGGDRLYNATTGAQAWRKPLSDGDIAVILYNSNYERDAEVAITFAMLEVEGWAATDKIRVRDLWANEDIGDFRGGYNAEKVPARDHVFLRLSKV